MRWSWKGPLALVGLIVLDYLVMGIVIIVTGQGLFEGLLVMLSVGILLALFVGSGFVAAKLEEYIQGRKSK